MSRSRGRHKPYRVVETWFVLEPIHGKLVASELIRLLIYGRKLARVISSGRRHVLVSVTPEVACWKTPPMYVLRTVAVELGIIRLSVVLNHWYSALNGYRGMGTKSEGVKDDHLRPTVQTVRPDRCSQRSEDSGMS